MRTIKIILPALAILLFASCGKEEIETRQSDNACGNEKSSVNLLESNFDNPCINIVHIDNGSIDRYRVSINKDEGDKSISLTIDMDDISTNSISTFFDIRLYDGPNDSCDGDSYVQPRKPYEFEGTIDISDGFVNVVGSIELACRDITTWIDIDSSLDDRMYIELLDIPEPK